MRPNRGEGHVVPTSLFDVEPYKPGLVQRAKLDGPVEPLARAKLGLKCLRRSAMSWSSGLRRRQHLPPLTRPLKARCIHKRRQGRCKSSDYHSPSSRQSNQSRRAASMYPTHDRAEGGLIEASRCVGQGHRSEYLLHQIGRRKMRLGLEKPYGHSAMLGLDHL